MEQTTGYFDQRLDIVGSSPTSPTTMRENGEIGKHASRKITTQSVSPIFYCLQGDETKQLVTSSIKRAVWVRSPRPFRGDSVMAARYKKPLKSYPLCQGVKDGKIQS